MERLTSKVKFKNSEYHFSCIFFIKFNNNINLYYNSTGVTINRLSKNLFFECSFISDLLQGHGFVPCLVANTFWLASVIYYLYITFLGYSSKYFFIHIIM